MEGREKEQGKTIQPNHWEGVRLETGRNQGPGPSPFPKEWGARDPELQSDALGYTCLSG